MPPQLRSLPSACAKPGTEIAQRFLASAYDSVGAVLENLSKLRQLRKDETGTDLRGRLTGNEEDLLRAAIVFTGAGLDAMLKQLIKDTLPVLLEVSEQAHRSFERFAEDRLGTGDIAEAKAIARYLTSENPRERLIEDYIYSLTGSSLQSADEVKRAAAALGLNMQNNGKLRRRIEALRPLFTARNEVSHELDLQRLNKPGDRTRRTRSISPTVKLCHDGLEVGQLIINGIGDML